ncbi:unnamed protein product [Parnassius mnemosyne]|uniref:Reverse transcriptase domain-containing protein n=1 Tax=Parnassius mnemosyne TaxID=213953 RepID=A0AAV1L1Y3_9NEOP
MRNGVAIVLDENLKQRIIDVDRRNDRLMAVKLAMDNQPPLNIISAYAPQTGCGESEKEAFWDEFDDLLISMAPEELKYIGGDLNGHVGASNTTYKDIQGKFGYGTLNKDGEQILEFCARHHLAVVNTFFNKKSEHLVTYKSGNKQSQIDYILTNRDLLRTFRDCKVIPGESLTSQHRILVGCIALIKPIKYTTVKIPKIKWHLLNTEKGDKLLEEIREILTEDMKNGHNISAENTWSKFENLCRNSAEKNLGISRGKLHNNKDPSCWNEEVKGALRNKKECFKQWQSSGLDDDHILYKTATKLAKYKVAKQRNYSREKFYKRLENANNDRDIFKLAKQRHKNGLDIKINKYIKNENGHLLTEDNKINERWCQYYQKLLNEEFPSQPLNTTPSAAGPLNKIGEEEVKRALKKIKNHKSVGPDSIPADLWKLLGPIAVQWLTKLFNQILTSMKIPKSWRHSYLVPFYKNKGDVSDCGNYRGIKLTSHTLKLWERILNNRLCQLVSISDNQCGFAPGRSTTDAIQAIRILMEKHRTNREDLHLVFIDLEKAFDRIPRKLFWEAMRAQQIPELYNNNNNNNIPQLSHNAI